MNKNQKTLYGRISLEDPKNKYSKFGVFEKKGNQELISLENIVTTNKRLKVYIRRTEEGKVLVNNIIKPGDIIKITGTYQENYFLGENVELISKFGDNQRSEFWEISKKANQIIKEKGNLLRLIRAYFNNQDFLEINTPILLPYYEGGDAAPFVTKTIKGKKYYLKETNELILRRLLTVNLGKVYEIGKSFRNIGINNNTLNEFTVIEAAIPYWNLLEGISFAEEILKNLIESVDNKSHLLAKWQRINFEKYYQDINGKKYEPKNDTPRTEVWGILF